MSRAPYTIRKELAAGKTEATAETEEISVTRGTLKKVRIRFYKGSEEQAYVKIFHKNRQILPSADDQSFRGDDEAILIECDIPIGNPAKITLKGWNTDATNVHAVTVELEIEVGEAVTISESFLPGWRW